MKYPITALQAKFCQEYISNGFDAQKAALSAGYSPQNAKSNAHLMPESPAVKQQLQKAYAKAFNKIALTFEQRIGYLQRIIADILPDDPEAKPQRMLYGIAIRSIAELNKMHGDYAPEKRLNMNVDVTRDKLLEAKRVYEDY